MYRQIKKTNDEAKRQPSCPNECDLSIVVPEIPKKPLYPELEFTV